MRSPSSLPAGRGDSRPLPAQVLRQQEADAPARLSIDNYVATHGRVSRVTGRGSERAGPTVGSERRDSARAAEVEAGRRAEAPRAQGHGHGHASWEAGVRSEAAAVCKGTPPPRISRGSASGSRRPASASASASPGSHFPFPGLASSGRLRLRGDPGRGRFSSGCLPLLFPTFQSETPPVIAS